MGKVSNYFRRGISIVVLSVISAFLILTVNIMPVSAADDANFGNLVLCVQFKDSETDAFNKPSEYAGSASNYQKIMYMYNDYTPYHGIDDSFKNYIKTVTGGKVIVQNVFPQDDGTKIVPFVLSKNMNAYTDDTDIILEVLAAIKAGKITISAADQAMLDYDKDGFIENLTIICQADTPVGRDNAAIYPHRSTQPMNNTVGSLSMSNYNILNTYALVTEVPPMAAGVISHEFLHSLGLPDLYRYAGEGAPVGSWDIMGSTGMYLQYPLAYLRATSGWMNKIPEISTAGQSHIELTPVMSSTGNQAYIFKTAKSDRQFFVVEYRKKNEQLTNGLPWGFETKIFGSGIIVYRVNLDVEGQTNSQGNDYIHIFRPGETGVNTSAGELNKAFLSADCGRTTIGSEDSSATISDGALVYSDGSNSGIVISNVGSAGDTISFDVTIPDLSNNGNWDETGTTGEMINYTIDMDHDSSNSPYVLESLASGGTYLKKWNGISWEKYGGNITNAGNLSKLVMVGDTPYVFVSDFTGATNKLYLKKWSGTTWINVYENQLAQDYYCNYPELMVSGTNIYIAYDSTMGGFYVTGNSINVVKVDTTNNTSSPVMTKSIKSASATGLAEYKGDIYLAYTDGATTSNVYKISGTNSTIMPELSMGANVGSHTMATWDGKLCIAATGNDRIVKVISYDGNNVTQLDNSLFKDCLSFGLASYDGYLYCTYFQGEDLYCSVLIDGTWQQMGDKIISKCGEFSHTLAGGRMYIAITYSDDRYLKVVSFDVSVKTYYDVLFKFGNETADSTQKVLKYGRANEPATPLKTGYEFAGWYNGEKQYNFSDSVTENLVLVAKWTEKATPPGHTHTWSDWTTTKAATCTAKGTQERFCSVCSSKETRDIDALGHNYSAEWTIDKAATCTTAGSKSHHCTVCGDKKDVIEIPALGHTWSDWTTTKAATCTTKGTQERSCSVCDLKETRDIDALGHNYSTEWTIDKAATCTTAGSKSHHCTVCGDKKDVTEIPALGHNYSTEWTIDKSATCTTAGSKSHHCTVCGDKKDVTEIPALGHTWSDWTTTKAATCTAKGTQERSCSVCDVKETRDIDALGHNYSTEWTIDKAATCTTAGSKSHHCTVCGDKKDVTEIPALGHTWSDWTTTKAATCIAKGTKVRTCSVCGTKETLDIDALGHNYSTDWTTDTPATCTTVGSKSHHCTVCGDKKDVTEIPALGHTWSDWTSTKAATCTTKGTQERSCSVCDVKETRDIDALGHNYSTEWTIDKAATCTTVGSKSHHCSVCGDKKDVTEIPAFGHNYSTEWTIDIVVRCTTDGSKSHHCTVCGDKKDITVIPATGHSWSEWKIIKAPTCTTSGIKERICSARGAKDTKEIPALGHNYSTKWTIDKAATCTTVGSKSHHCTVCGDKKDVTKIAATGHKSVKTTIVKATTTKNGKYVQKCSTCGKTVTNYVLYKVNSIRLSKTTYIFSGKACKPKEIVKTSKGKVLKRNVDYKVSYSGKCINSGVYKVKIKLIGKYTGTLEQKFYIVPKGTKITKFVNQVSSKKLLTVYWQKQSKYITGYQIIYSTNSKMKSGIIKVNVKSYKKTSLMIKKLKPKKNYYFRIRTYVISAGKTYYSAWSPIKKILTK